MAPHGNEEKDYFRWHIRVLPRVTTPAGFELGSGMSINTTMPEDAAAFLLDGDMRMTLFIASQSGSSRFRLARLLGPSLPR